LHIDGPHPFSRARREDRPRPDRPHGAPGLTPATRTGLEDLATIIDGVRRDGYCVVNQELDFGLNSIAVPVYNSMGRVVAAMNVASSPSRVPAEEMVERYLPALQELQKQLRPLIRN
jgi:IclR family pca regulon transcriptional regulator